MELDCQEFIDARCTIRFDAVAEYYRVYEADGWRFTEGNIHEIEKTVLWTRLRAFEDFSWGSLTRGLRRRGEHRYRAEQVEMEAKKEGRDVRRLVPFNDGDTAAR